MKRLVRFKDWLQERRIRDLADAARSAMWEGEWDKGREIWAMYAAEHKKRSAETVRRMERGFK